MNLWPADQSHAITCFPVSLGAAFNFSDSCMFILYCFLYHAPSCSAVRPSQLKLLVLAMTLATPAGRWHFGAIS